MSLTTVTYKGSVDQRLDMRWLSTAANESKSTNEVLKESIIIGNQNVSVADLFDISGSLSSEEIVLENTNEKMDYIGFLLNENKKCTIHGEGKSLRTFIHVHDVCTAVDVLLKKSRIGDEHDTKMAG